jgi:hypothetical protein
MGVGRYTATRWLHILGDRKRDHSRGVGLVVFRPARTIRTKSRFSLAPKVGGSRLRFSIICAAR